MKPVLPEVKGLKKCIPVMRGFLRGEEKSNKYPGPPGPDICFAFTNIGFKYPSNWVGTV